jgi:two-component sensor histidine kinase
MHRAYGFLRLADARAGQRDLTRTNPMAADQECVIARDLAARFDELEVAEDRAAQPCAAVLRDVVTGVGALFGRSAGVAVATEIQAMSLPSYKRRALVLAANELVVNSLLHAFPGRGAGVIEVSLTVHGTELASLRVADDGIGLADARPNLDCGVAASLAGLLEADLTYERRDGWTIAEIAFPHFESWCGPPPWRDRSGQSERRQHVIHAIE